MTSELSNFLPYLLNQAAEMVSRDFQPHYKDRYGMLRTEWRVLFHLGRNGKMTATQICRQASIHKTKVSRAVTALEMKRYVERTTMTSDRRHEVLSLTKSGMQAFADLARKADMYDRGIETILGSKDVDALKRILARLISERDAAN